MRTKIVYVLVSQESDYYYEMLLLSLYSLRLYHPKGDAEVEVVMDEGTHRRLVDKKAEMLNDVTPIVVPIPPEYTVMQRSRYLKTRLRQLVNGDFLYIDSDTIICDSLEKVDQLEADVVMLPEGISSWWLNIFQKANLSISHNTSFFNSGVIYTKDTDSVYKLFEEWFRLWKYCVSSGINYDQPSFCIANTNVGCITKGLTTEWNYSLKRAGVDIKKEARIFHYFTYSKGIVRKMLMDYIRENGVDNTIVNDIVLYPLTTGQAFFQLVQIRLIDMSSPAC